MISQSLLQYAKQTLLLTCTQYRQCRADVSEKCWPAAPRKTGNMIIALHQPYPQCQRDTVWELVNTDSTEKSQPCNPALSQYTTQALPAILYYSNQQL